MTPDPEMRELTLKVRHKSEIADGVFLFELASATAANCRRSRRVRISP